MTEISIALIDKGNEREWNVCHDHVLLPSKVKEFDLGEQMSINSEYTYRGFFSLSELCLRWFDDIRKSSIIFILFLLENGIRGQTVSIYIHVSRIVHLLTFRPTSIHSFSGSEPHRKLKRYYVYCYAKHDQPSRWSDSTRWCESSHSSRCRRP